MATSEDTHNIWTERFRPKSVKQIILPSKVKKKINKIISSGVLPNLLIYDPKPGNGKSSLSRYICNDMGIEDVLYANGSGEANIDFLRNDITSLADFEKMKDKIILGPRGRMQFRLKCKGTRTDEPELIRRVMALCTSPKIELATLPPKVV